MSSIAAQSELQRDAILAGRFDLRVWSFVRFVIPFHVALVLLNFTLDQQFLTACAHLAMAAIAWLVTMRCRDGIRIIIFTNVYWMFSVATYAYAFLNGQTASYGLGNAERAALVALVSQLALYMACLLTPNRGVLLKTDEFKYLRRRSTLNTLQYPFLIVGLLGVIVGNYGLLPSAYAATIGYFLLVAMSIRLAGGKIAQDPVLLGIFALMFYISAASSGRTALMALLFMLGFAVLMLKEKIISFGTLIAAYFTMRLLSIFSALLLSVRWTRGTSVSTAELFASKFFALDTAFFLINPFYVHPVQLEAATAPENTSGFYSDFFRAGSDSLLQRLTLLPQMDIVVSKIRDISAIRWDDLWSNIVWNVLPGIFGQDKDLLFSDQIVWELGLRDWASVGRPMITVQGELFSIGGYVCVFLVTFYLYYMMSYLYGVMARMMGGRVTAILIMSQFFVNGFVSTTLLSVAMASTRTPFQFIALLSVIFFIFGMFTKRDKPLRKRKFA